MRSCKCRLSQASNMNYSILEFQGLNVPERRRMKEQKQQQQQQQQIIKTSRINMTANANLAIRRCFDEKE